MALHSVYNFLLHDVLGNIVAGVLATTISWGVKAIRASRARGCQQAETPPPGTS